MDNEFVQIALQAWGDKVATEAQRNLAKQGKNSTKKLSKSIQAKVVGSKLIFSFEEYGIALDTGRNGTKKRRNSNSIFGQPAKAAFPNVTAIKKWIKNKPISFKGKKVSVDSQAYVIGRSIKLNGIKASLFFTKAFNKELPELGELIAEAFTLDLEDKYNN